MKTKQCTNNQVSIVSDEDCKIFRSAPRGLCELYARVPARRYSLNRTYTTPVAPMASLFGSDDDRSDTDFCDLEPFDPKTALCRSMKQPNLALYRKLFTQDGDPYLSQKSNNSSNSSFRITPKKFRNPITILPNDPFRILDLPGYEDDYYSSLIAWSVKDKIAAAIQESLYIFDNKTADASLIFQADDEQERVTATAYSADGNHVVLGTIRGRILVFDVETEKKMTSIAEEAVERVSCFDWHSNGLLAAGKDSTGVIMDMRRKKPKITEFLGHDQNICAINWARDGQRFATGGNDNIALAWDLKFTEPLMTMRHKGGVRGLCWSPFESNILSSGGGSTDRCIKTWDVSLETMIEQRDTGSQICSLVYSQLTQDIITTHGFPNNEISLWRARGLKKVGSMTGHEERPLSLCLSPDRTTILTASGDESMRFWKVFEGKRSPSDKVRTRDNSGVEKKLNLDL